ncbi:hypothetical protein AO391_03530 [Pseudomonas marginalis ICMP 9505]|nr:hypothetical protein AO391_03530 [Pseudomonas marginalis ICMP 9505]
MQSRRVGKQIVATFAWVTHPVTLRVSLYHWTQSVQGGILRHSVGTILCSGFAKMKFNLGSVQGFIGKMHLLLV